MYTSRVSRQADTLSTPKPAPDAVEKHVAASQPTPGTQRVAMTSWARCVDVDTMLTMDAQQQTSSHHNSTKAQKPS